MLKQVFPLLPFTQGSMMHCCPWIDLEKQLDLFNLNNQGETQEWVKSWFSSSKTGPFLQQQQKRKERRRCSLLLWSTALLTFSLVQCDGYLQCSVFWRERIKVGHDTCDWAHGCSLPGRNLLVARALYCFGLGKEGACPSSSPVGWERYSGFYSQSCVK